MTSAEVMITIPTMVSNWGYSPGSKSQLSTAPKSGIKNFQRFRSETTIPGLFNKVIQMDMATDDNKLSQASDKK